MLLMIPFGDSGHGFSTDEPSLGAELSKFVDFASLPSALKT